MDVTSDKKSKKVPVSIITGFLGSGKTTLIKHLVAQPSMNNIALIINEFGEVGLDNLLIESSIENTLLLENGCICCSIRGDLIDTINDLFTKALTGKIAKFTRIVIETTGLANPGPIINCIRSDNVISTKCELSNVITLVDGIQGASQLVKYSEAKIQVAQADLCLISKCDIGSPRNINNLEKDLLKINPILRVENIENGRINSELLFGTVSPEFRSIELVDHHFNEGTEGFSHGDISSWSFESDIEVDELRFRDWINMLYSLRPYSMLRMKGIVKFKDRKQSTLIQAVGCSMSKLQEIDGWSLGLNQTRLVLIFTGLSKQTVSSSFARWVLNERGSQRKIS